MSKKPLRFAQFVAMSPEAKVKKWAENCWAELQPMIIRFKRHIQENCQGFSETNWGRAGEPLSFDEEELKMMVGLIFEYRCDPCLRFARTLQNEHDDRLPQNTGEVLLKLMRKYHGLVFGYKDSRTSKFVEGIMARIQVVRARTNEIDSWLCSTDFRGQAMFDLLETLHKAGFKTASQDFVEKRIERLLGKG